ncbi:hypothetical protein ABH19_04850 [Leptospirillum sp. Group II 'CF-1']|nr:hypothetical protein ABH19_04850 [Leptospirillum sp. Group II 'CF-1']
MSSLKAWDHNRTNRQNRTGKESVAAEGEEQDNRDRNTSRRRRILGSPMSHPLRRMTLGFRERPSTTKNFDMR